MKKQPKIAVSSPRIRLCDPEYNAAVCVSEAEKACANGADLIVFPELALTGATAGDLFCQDVLLDRAEAALTQYVEATEKIDIMSFIGFPIKCEGYTYNAVACVHCGEIIGISASGLETAHFSKVPDQGISATVAGQRADVARDHIYSVNDDCDVFVKIGDDNAFSCDGVSLIINPCSMPEYLGLAKARREYANSASASIGVPFVVAGAGCGESGTDGIYAAPRLVSAGGEIIAESELFDEAILYSEIPPVSSPTDVSFKESDEIMRFPFIPEGENERREACALALEIQSRSLALRIERSYSKCAVIGVSGGLDSTLAVLVCAMAMDKLGYSRDRVIAITMPCFGTTERTKSNALALAEELGCTARTVDIKAAVSQHFKDIGHDESDYNVVYENSQARERTQILMDIANAEGGLVVGTGDLSELALGFATYNGDHMSMYCVNGSVPKTLMRSIISYAADKACEEGMQALGHVLRDVIDTPISPELLPLDNGENKQHTEGIVGPYELHDFFLYYTVKYGYSPSKILDFAHSVFDEYDRKDIKYYLDIFVRRFFTQQFKRSCMPDGPRVTEISLSPRGAWNMPSDVSANIWRGDLAREE